MFDLNKLTKKELLELNHRVVERLISMHKAQIEGAKR